MNCMWRSAAVGVMVAAASAAFAQDASKTIRPAEAVQLAGEYAPDGAKGSFAFVVRSAAKTPRGVYLNSADDYRDPLNLSVELDRSMAATLKTQLGEGPETFYKGKAIIVDGTARRVKVTFAGRGLPTDKYYYQTRIAVNDPAQIHLVDGPR